MALPSSKKRKIFDGRYEVIEIVGRGSDSVVYHAKYIGSSTQEIALKVLVNQKGKTSLTARLRKEALTLVSCRHKYVVRLDDFHSVDDLCYLAMEYAPQGDLRKYADSRGGILQVESATLFLQQVLEALDFVHATGVIHRDIKPDNILVSREDEIRLADFGLALLPGDDLSVDDLKSGVGSFAYLPPESLEGIRYDSRSDLYALGLCFYELLSGSHPFQTLPIAEQLEKRRDGALKPLHEIDPLIPRHLSAVISTLMKFDANARFQSALEAIKALGNPEFTEHVIEQRMVANAAPFEPERAAYKAPEVASEIQPVTASAAANADVPVAATTGSEEAAELDHSYSITDEFRHDEIDQPAPVVDEPELLSAETDDAGLFEDEGDDDLPEIDRPEDDEYRPIGERVSQPTQRIDLARIKEIIAKDSRKKAEVAARKERVDREQGTQAEPTPQKQQSELAVQSQQYNMKSKETAFEGEDAGGAAAIAWLRSLILDRFRAIPPRLRPAAVGLAASLLTIATVALYQMLPFGSDSSQQPMADNSELEQPIEGASDRGSAAVVHAFPNIPEGTYVGHIDDLIPGVRAPITLISKAKHRQLVVIVGIDGWSPAFVSTTPEENSPSSTLAIRSNGMILYVTGELSSGTITGTFNNAVTGEAGSWRVSKFS